MKATPLRKSRKPSHRGLPIPVRALDFVMYCTKNMRQTRAFYQKLFGFKPGEEWHNGWSEFATKPLTFCLDGPGKGGEKSIWDGPPAIAFALSECRCG
jgi:hypothetical protein